MEGSASCQTAYSGYPVILHILMYLHLLQCCQALVL